MTEALESSLDHAWFRLHAKYPNVSKVFYSQRGDKLLLGIDIKGHYTQALIPVREFSDKEKAWDTVEYFLTTYCNA